jgi:hypothetical protein
VKDYGSTLSYGTNEMRIPHIAAYDPDGFEQFLIQIFQMAPVVARVVMYQRTNVCPRARERFSQMAADEAAGARN